MELPQAILILLNEMPQDLRFRAGMPNAFTFDSPIQNHIVSTQGATCPVCGFIRQWGGIKD
jgi:hypothetical protein